MKKHVLIAAGLAVLSTSAFATKARMEALGQGAGASRGSFYIDDSRNVFRNAATVNSMKNYVLTEWGVDATNSTDTEAAPNAEGGFFKEAGSFSYGLYLGNVIGHENAARNGALSSLGQTLGEAGFLKRDNQLDLFIAGDAGVEWGVRLGYAKGESEVTGGVKKEHSAMDVGLGVNAGDLSAWANLDLSDESKGASEAGDKWEADLGLHLGASYKVAGMTAFAEYNKTGFEYTDPTNTATKPTQETSSIQVGVGKTYDHGNGNRMITNVSFLTSTVEEKTTAGEKEESKSTRLPFTVGFEADATTWLTLRGSVSYTLPVLNETEEKNGGTTTKSTPTNTADIAAGGTLNFGKLKVDGVIGTDGAAGETGKLTLDDVMTRVAVHYWF